MHGALLCRKQAMGLAQAISTSSAPQQVAELELCIKAASNSLELGFADVASPLGSGVHARAVEYIAEILAVTMMPVQQAALERAQADNNAQQLLRVLTESGKQLQLTHSATDLSMSSIRRFGMACKA